MRELSKKPQRLRKCRPRHLDAAATPTLQCLSCAAVKLCGVKHPTLALHSKNTIQDTRGYAASRLDLSQHQDTHQLSCTKTNECYLLLFTPRFLGSWKRHLAASLVNRIFPNESKTSLQSETKLPQLCISRLDIGEPQCRLLV